MEERQDRTGQGERQWGSGLIASSVIGGAWIASRATLRAAVDLEELEVRLRAVCPLSLYDDAMTAVEDMANTWPGMRRADAIRSVTASIAETGELPRG